VLGDVGGVVTVEGVPDDCEGHAQELEGYGPLHGAGGAVAGMADAGELFSFFKADLDRPAVAVALDELVGSGV